MADLNSIGSTGLAAGALAGANNTATYVPIWLPCDAVIYELRFRAANGTGNYDLGIYDKDFNRIASTGSTAMSASGTKTLSLSNRYVKGGELAFYAALALSSTSGTILRCNGTVARWRMSGVLQQLTALPLPNPATPISPTDTVIPVFALGVR